MMADQQTTQPGPVSMEDFEQEAGLQSNEAPAPDADEPDDEGGLDRADTSDVDADQDKTIEQHTAELLADEDEYDNLKLLDRRREREAAERAQAETEATDDEEDADAETESTEDDEAAAEEGAEEEGGEEQETEEDEEADGAADLEGLDAILSDPEQAQSALDRILEAHPELTIPYTANGEQLREPLSAVTKKAAGYAGEGEVTRRFQAARQAEQEATSKLKKAEEVRDQVVETYGQLLDEPKRFVSDFVMQSDESYIRQLYDEMTAVVMQMDEDPNAFAIRREMGGMKRILSQLVQGGGQPGTGAGHDPAGDGAPTPDGGKETPDAGDYGFVVGRGYPQDQRTAALRALDHAASVVGITQEQVDSEVIPMWEKEGRRRPVFEVLRDVVQGRFAETEKVEAAKKPPKKRTPRSTSSNPTGKRGKPRKRAGGTSWDDIPAKIEQRLEEADS